MTESPFLPYETTIKSDNNRNQILQMTNRESKIKTRTELNTEPLIKNPEGTNNMKGNKENLNILLMFGFIMIGFFVLSLIMTALIFLSFRYDFEFFLSHISN